MSAPPQAAPRLVAGLGNPGPQYFDTRHNAGFWFVERLAEQLKVGLGHESRFHGFCANARASGVEGGTWLLMPQTYMNRSGQSVGALARFYRVLPHEILVVHDELDIPPGQLRLKFGGGLGGHNGLKDIAAHLGTQDFWRLRIGIGHPRDARESAQDVADYVLHRASREQQAEIDAAMQRALELWPMLARAEWERAIARANARPAAPKAAPTTQKPPAAPGGDKQI
ncbi:MAG: aminoacyl-tRNA hydrolase [Rhodocyclaceae bacterium]|nr:aminoacyl-tRNA hydrolase [Rhodocyclaceae bacterium]MBX3667374.1 aminoacyl-tRNA hydrolase [Rhodocyclaceae bacterium]